jgi:hypothetical protein
MSLWRTTLWAALKRALKVTAMLLTRRPSLPVEMGSSLGGAARPKSAQPVPHKDRPPVAGGGARESGRHAAKLNLLEGWAGPKAAGNVAVAGAARSPMERRLEEVAPQNHANVHPN